MKTEAAAAKESMAAKHFHFSVLLPMGLSHTEQTLLLSITAVLHLLQIINLPPLLKGANTIYS